MSKGSLLMGTAGGKLGNMVLFRAGGQERQRAYVSTVANPRSDAQMRTRIRFASAGLAFRQFGIATDRMRLAKVGTTRYNAFMKENWAIAPYMPPSSTPLPLYAPWVVSNGSLLTTWTPSYTWQQLAGSFGIYSESFLRTVVSVDLALTDIAAARQQTEYATHGVQMILELIWNKLGLPFTHHICSVAADGAYQELEDTVPLIQADTTPRFAEVWPTSDFVTSLGDGGLSIAATGVVSSVASRSDPMGGTGVSGRLYYIDNNPFWDNLTLYFDEEDEDAGTQRFVLAWKPFNNYVSTTPENQRDLMEAAWIANGETNETSRAVIHFAGRGAQYAATNTSERAFEICVPYWRSADAALNQAVYGS